MMSTEGSFQRAPEVEGEQGPGLIDAAATSRLLPLVYRELRDVARALMAKTPPGQTLEPTALVHEAYLRLMEKGHEEWHGRGHFFAAATRAMRDILVESARRRAALKRGGDRKRCDLQAEELAVEPPQADDFLALDEALSRLERDDPRKAQVIHLRFFGGLELAEIAAILGVSEATVKRDWRYSLARLRLELSGSAAAAKGTGGQVAGNYDAR
jgi:RNA polymerase sigma factor (TIGR02999 family)